MELVLVIFECSDILMKNLELKHSELSNRFGWLRCCRVHVVPVKTLVSQSLKAHINHARQAPNILFDLMLRLMTPVHTWQDRPWCIKIAYLYNIGRALRPIIGCRAFARLWELRVAHNTAQSITFWLGLNRIATLTTTVTSVLSNIPPLKSIKDVNRAYAAHFRSRPDSDMLWRRSWRK